MADFRTFVKSFDGEPIKNGDKEIMIGELCVTAILANYDDEKGLDGNEKVLRFKLANKIFDAVHSLAGNVELEAEEISLIKKLVAKHYGPLVVGRVYECVDPPSLNSEKTRERKKERS